MPLDAEFAVRTNKVTSQHVMRFRFRMYNIVQYHPPARLLRNTSGTLTISSKRTFPSFVILMSPAPDTNLEGKNWWMALLVYNFAAAIGNLLHFHRSFGSKIAPHNFLETSCCGDVDLKGLGSPSHLGFRIQRLYSRHLYLEHSPRVQLPIF